MIKSFAYTAKSELERSLALCTDRAIFSDGDGQQTGVSISHGDQQVTA